MSTDDVSEDFPASKLERSGLFAKTGLKVGKNYAQYLMDRATGADDPEARKRELNTQNARDLFKEFTRLRIVCTGGPVHQVLRIVFPHLQPGFGKETAPLQLGSGKVIGSVVGAHTVARSVVKEVLRVAYTAPGSSSSAVTEYDRS